MAPVRVSGLPSRDHRHPRALGAGSGGKSLSIDRFPIRREPTYSHYEWCSTTPSEALGSIVSHSWPIDSHSKDADSPCMAPTAADHAARNMRAERARRRWTQQELADRLGWSQAKVSAVEVGQRTITLDALIELCRVFEVPLAKLLEGADQADLHVLGLVTKS